MSFTVLPFFLDKSRRDDMCVAMSMSPRPLLRSPGGTACDRLLSYTHTVPPGLKREKGNDPRCYTHTVPTGLKRKTIIFQTASKVLKVPKVNKVVSTLAYF